MPAKSPKKKPTASKPSVFPLGNPFPLVDKNYLKDNFGQSEGDITAMRQSLDSPTYWIQRNRKILYNLRLWEHYLRCVVSGDSSDRKAHDRLLEYYAGYCSGLLEGVRNPNSDHLQGLESYLDLIKEKLSG